MHSRGILHRDIQLGNCTLGLGKTEGVIYMIDFGFSKRYIDPHTRKHIPDSKAKRDFIGNYWFSSVNVHCRGRGNLFRALFLPSDDLFSPVPSRRDDMEALALMLIHVLTDGGLPWTRNGVPKTDSAHETLIRKKLRAKPEELCRGLPPVFEDFLRYCRRLKFLEQPDYNFWREQFELLAVVMGYVEPDGSVNDDFVWPPRPDEVRASITSLQSYALTPLPQTPRHMHTSPPRRRMSGGEVGLYDLLEEIAKMRLEDRKLVQPAKKRSDPKPPAGHKNSQTPPDPSPSNDANENDRKGKPASREAQPPPSQRESSGDSKRKPVKQLGVIVISDSSDEEFKPSRRMARGTKQATLRLLTRRARSSKDNVTLADLLHQFIDTYSLTGTRSRIVTRDAFDFLDVVVQQLEDPSGVLVHGSQPSTQSSGTFDSQTQSEETSQLESTNSRLRQRVPAQKMETVKALRLRLQSAPSAMTKAQLAKLLAEFCQAVRVTSGKTLTKDGIAFLEAVESRLRQL